MAEKWDLQLRICRDLQQLVMPMDFMLPSWSVGVSEKTGRRLEIRFLIPYRARQGMPGGGHSDLDPVAREGGTIGPALEHWTFFFLFPDAPGTASCNDDAQTLVFARCPFEKGLSLFASSLSKQWPPPCFFNHQ